MVDSKNPSSDHYKNITPHLHEYVNLKNHPKLAKSERRPRRSLGEDGMSTPKMKKIARFFRNARRRLMTMAGQAWDLLLAFVLLCIAHFE